MESFLRDTVVLEFWYPGSDEGLAETFGDLGYCYGTMQWLDIFGGGEAL